MTTQQDDGRGLVAELVEALKRADQFITNGIKYGFIEMPGPGSGDLALETPEIVRAALAKAKRVSASTNPPPSPPGAAPNIVQQHYTFAPDTLENMPETEVQAEVAKFDDATKRARSMDLQALDEQLRRDLKPSPKEPQGGQTRVEEPPFGPTWQAESWIERYVHEEGLRPGATKALAKLLSTSPTPGRAMPTRERISEILWQYHNSIVNGNGCVAADAILSEFKRVEEEG